MEPAPNDRRGRRWAAAGTVVLGILLAVAIERLSRQVPFNSDQASSVLEGWAMSHGNVLLGGWTLPSDSFFTDKLPLLALLERFQGLTSAVEYEAAGLLGAGVVLAGMWLAGARLRGRTRAVAMLVAGALLASQALLLPANGPSFPSGVLLPAGSDHAASLLLLLVAYLALEGVGRSRLWLVLAWLALALASIGDPLAAVVGGGAIAAVAVLDLAVGRRDGARNDVVLICVGLSSAVAAPLAWWGIRRAGGYTAAPLLGGGYGLPPLVSSLSHNLSVGGQALLTLFGADFLSHPAGLAWVSIVLHLSGLALVVAVLVVLLRPRRWLELDLISRILAFGMLADAAAYLIGQQATDLTSARYLVPFLGFGAVLAGRQGVPRLMALRSRLWLGGVALGAAYAAIFAAGAVAAQPAPAPFAAVTAWLTDHGASDGLGTYWDANVVTVSSGGAIRVRAVSAASGSLAPFLWHTTIAWYEPDHDRATFVILAAGDTADRSVVETSLGPPSETANVAGTTIMVWPGNVMGELAPP
ncbi:MAG: hypothetical protein ABR950_06455 [Candidatus Dormibacteria bacterium]